MMIQGLPDSQIDIEKGDEPEMTCLPFYFIQLLTNGPKSDRIRLRDTEAKAGRRELQLSTSLCRRKALPHSRITAPRSLYPQVK